MVTDKHQPPNSLDTNPHLQDLTGRNRQAYNVLTGWIGQLVFVASGFILPRMINSNLGQDALGVWDFSWSLITYFELIYGGLVSSVNRYVAKHRSVNDISGVNTAVSSVFFTLLVLASLVALLSTATALSLPVFMQDKLGALTQDAQWVIFFLGLNLVVKISLAVFGGILTGCHRWDLQHGMNALNRIVALVAMSVTLALGGGLPEITVVFFCCEAVILGSRCSLAFRVCPGLRISHRLIRKSTIQNMWHFGLKTLLPDLGDLLNNQTFNLMLVWFIGPAALASYARPRGLVRHIQTFVRRYALTLTPTASSMQAASSAEESRLLLTSSCRVGALITLPMTAILAVMGGPLLLVWMGPEYADDILPAILALGYLPILLQLPLNSVLQGFNSHGWPGLFKLIASATGIVLAFISLTLFHSNITMAAALLFLPFWISEFIATPLYATRQHPFSIWRYWLVGIFQPLLITTPMIVTLFCFRILYSTSPSWSLFGGISAGMLAFVLSFWFFGANDAFRDSVLQRVKRVGV